MSVKGEKDLHSSSSSDTHVPDLEQGDVGQGKDLEGGIESKVCYDTKATVRARPNHAEGIRATF